MSLSLGTLQPYEPNSCRPTHTDIVHQHNQLTQANYNPHNFSVIKKINLPKVFGWIRFMLFPFVGFAFLAQIFSLISSFYFSIVRYFISSFFPQKFSDVQQKGAPTHTQALDDRMARSLALVSQPAYDGGLRNSRCPF